MKRFFIKYIDKLFFKQWVIGICKDNIDDIIRNKNFDSEINWLIPKSFEKFYADPFLLNSNDGNIKILFEEFKFEEEYGKIALLTLNKKLNKINEKILLDTKSHLSYPFIFAENNKYYIFPEAAKSGKLSCYEYDPQNEKLSFLKNILDMPLLDSTILKHEGKYWILGSLGNNTSTYNLYAFFSDSLLGSYTPHSGNPIKSGLDGVRSAGNYINASGTIYRPTQNCKNKYGESITLNKINKLTEIDVLEEPYMFIQINRKKRNNRNIHSIHTINVINDLIVVDGEHWTFAPFRQLKKWKLTLIDKIKKEESKKELV